MRPMGEDVRAALGAGPDEARRTRQRARFVAEAHGRQGRWLKELSLGALAAALASAAVIFVWQQRAPAGLEQPRREGSAFVFNEASQVYLEPGAQAHVAKANGHEAVVVLERGELTVSITSGRKNLWRFRAGENEVIVRGTKFSMLWKPSSESLDVQVSEGKVEVHTADGQLRFVTAGDRLSFTKPPPAPEEHAEAEVVHVDEEPEVQLAETKKPAPAPGRVVAQARVPEPEPVKPQPELRPLVPEWKRQAEGGRYAKAVALVEEQGVDGAMQGVLSDDLLLFADAARLARRMDLGRSALSMLRERHPGTADAAEAAFRLGRLEFDAQHFPEAGTWFDTCVKEAPRGPFISEAFGRRLDAWHRARDERAAQAASDYLERYPKGAYAPLASQVLSGQ